MPATRLSHQAFLYAAADEFASAMAPVVSAGVERGDRVVVAAKRDSVAALRDELGSRARDVELYDTAAWHPNPVHRLMAVQRALAELPAGRQLLALGEPVWTGSEATRREWVRYESTINVALADSPLRFVCLYDRSALPERILDHGRATHPELVDGHDCCPSDAFTAPADYVPGLAAGNGSPHVGDVCGIPFEDDHHDFRARLAARAIAAGMHPDRIEELVLAANEITANAVLHGRPPIAARCWTEHGDFVCEVSDGGPGVSDPFAGWLLPPPGARRGWGLALARRICDALEVSSGAKGSCVRLYVALGECPELDSNQRPSP